MYCYFSKYPVVLQDYTNFQKFLCRIEYTIFWRACTERYEFVTIQPNGCLVTRGRVLHTPRVPPAQIFLKSLRDFRAENLQGMNFAEQNSPRPTGKAG